MPQSEIMRESRVLLILSLAVGILVGLIGGVYNYITNHLNVFRDFVAENTSNTGVVIVMALGTFISYVLVKKYAPEAGGSGVQEVEGTMIGKRKIKWKQVIPVKFFGGIAAQLGGMVVGREGPTIHLGGALGDMLTGFWKGSKYSEIDIKNHLLACGAGAGLAVAFNAPIAGVLLVIEEMRPSFKFNFRSYTGIMMASFVSTWIAQFIVGDTLDIPVGIGQITTIPQVHYFSFILFGVFMSLTGAGFLFTIKGGYKVFDFLKTKAPYVTFAVVAISFAIIFQTNSDYNSSGMDLLANHLNETQSISELSSLIVGRLIGGTISFCSGVVGGVFSPMLYIGASLGKVYALLVPSLHAYSTELAIIGMAGFFTAVVGAPLTGVILMAELTGQYQLLLPLGIVCMITAMMMRFFGMKPLYESLLNRDIRIFGDESIKKHISGNN